MVCEGRPTPAKKVPSKQLGVETKGCKMNSQGGHKGAIGKNFYKLLLVYPVQRLRVEGEHGDGKAERICDGCCVVWNGECKGVEFLQSIQEIVWSYSNE